MRLANVRRSGQNVKDVDAVLHRLGDVIVADPFARREIGDRARHLEHAIVGAGAEREPSARGREQRRPAPSERAPPREAAPRQVARSTRVAPTRVPVGLNARAASTRARTAATARPARRPRAARARHGGHVDGQVDAIAQRTRQPAAVARDLQRRAAALATGSPREARRDTGSSPPTSMNRRREDRGPRGARDGHRALFERLPQHFQRAPVELRHLVEKQDAVVGQADFARPRTAIRRRPARRRRSCDAARGTAARRAGRRRTAAGRRRSGWRVDSSASSKVSGGRMPACAARASSCRRPEARRAGGCGLRPRRSRARGGRAACPRTSARSGCWSGARGTGASDAAAGRRSRVVQRPHGFGQRRHRPDVAALRR